jgi:predicted enzyme related to lactoylglutathione lyase
MSQHDPVDPLTVLHADDLPVQPDPASAARLRSRLESVLSLPPGTEGVVMSGTAQAIAELTEPVVASAPPRPAVLPYLIVADARAAIAWYTDALGAVLVGDPVVTDDGRIGHLENARRRDAVVQREIHENYGSRNATIIDPFGHRRMISGPLRGSVSRIRHGDIGYVSVWTRNAERAAAFYGHVLGWTYDSSRHQITNTAEHIGIFAVDDHPTLFCCYAVDDLEAARPAIVDAGGRPAEFREFYGRVPHWGFEPGRIDDGWQISGAQPMGGVAGGSDRATTVPMWTVADIEEAVTKVREAGGTVIQEPSTQPYGQMAECVDDQGGGFYLGQF